MSTIEASADTTVLNRMIEEQDCEWGALPDEALAGPLPTRVEHLVDMLLRKIQQPVDKDDEPLPPLTRTAFRHFAMRTLGCGEQMLNAEWVKAKQPGEVQ